MLTWSAAAYAKGLSLLAFCVCRSIYYRNATCHTRPRICEHPLPKARNMGRTAAGSLVHCVQYSRNKCKE
jgi:hypothetical protein